MDAWGVEEAYTMHTSIWYTAVNMNVSTLTNSYYCHLYNPRAACGVSCLSNFGSLSFCILEIVSSCNYLKLLIAVCVHWHVCMYITQTHCSQHCSLCWLCNQQPAVNKRDLIYMAAAPSVSTLFLTVAPHPAAHTHWYIFLLLTVGLNDIYRSVSGTPNF